MKAETVSERRVEPDELRGRLRRYRGALSFIHKVADGSIILGSLAIAMQITETDPSGRVALSGMVAALVFHLFAKAKSLYRSWRMGAIRKELRYTVEAWLGAMGVALATVYLYYGSTGYPRELLLWWLVLTPVLLCAWRLGVRHVLRLARSHGINTRRLAIVRSGEFARHVARTVANNSWIGFRVVGLFDEKPAEEVRSLETLVGLARNGDVDVIYITVGPDESEQRIENLLRRLGDSTTSAYVVYDRRSAAPALAAADGVQLPGLPPLQWLHHWWVDIGGIQAVSVYETPFLGPDGWVKRMEDISVSCVALLLLALPMAIIALGVKLSGPGPVFFKQRRYGLDGREIVVWKFRSMNQCDDGAEVKQAVREDPRVTPFGAFLRRTSLDELPQFINVLGGTMSVVGPRPHAVAHNEYYRGLVSGYMLRHKVKPGITGWAQVNGFRGETELLDKMRQRVEFDLAYIRHWSLWLDLRIIAMTALNGMVHRNAY